MQMVTEEDVDLMLDADGQPTAGTDGQSELAEDDMCWLQDLKNEALTEEGELFYEDEEGNGSYGFGMWIVNTFSDKFF